ncbi:MAG TPA: plastocyanin/azurin family copper-binding protein [Actinomycetota bacterium]|jgi:plastocyanin|nr:plastocyanin/azurin family copper-binding protein [Actinomycetota bacterium]
MTSSRLATVTAVLALALLPAASHGATTTVKAVDSSTGWAFSPKSKTVVKGTTVKWVGQSETIHQIGFYKKPAGVSMAGFSLSPGDSKKRTFKKKGVYKYRCTMPSHSTLSEDKKTCVGMCGQIKVTS